MIDNTSEVAHFESLYPSDSRFEEIEKMLGFIKQGHSCQVVGLPGSGQSTLLKLLSYNRNVRVKHLGKKQEQYHFVLTNFSELRKRPLLDVTKFMFLSLVDSLRERGLHDEYEKTYTIFKESIALNDEMVMFQGLKNAIDFLTLEKNLTVVFLLDRFEEYIPMLTDDFFRNLRVLRNRAKYKFSIVASLNRPLEDDIEPSLISEFYDFLVGHIVYLPLMDKPGTDFRIAHLETLTGKTLNADTKKQILLLTGGIGRLTKNCVQTVLSSPDKSSTDKTDPSAYFLAQPSIQSPLADIWQTLSPSEQDFLFSNTIYTASDQDYPYLANVGLLHDGKITIPLLWSYMQSSQVKTEQKAVELITFNPGSNEIKQGKITISDRLTSSEFRLLSFLLEHAGAIVDREAIINAVWKEAVSTAGVTDQALDQLFFRIRHKIEDDPNNPQHIQTVKGRGIRFVP
jgi:DNA-binding winged helix-turn-helix (wHTH) protein